MTSRGPPPRFTAAASNGGSTATGSSSSLPLADQLRALAASLVAVSAPNSAANSPKEGPQDFKTAAPAQRKALRRAKAKAEQLFKSRPQHQPLPIGGVSSVGGLRIDPAPNTHRLPATERLIEKLRSEGRPSGMTAYTPRSSTGGMASAVGSTTKRWLSTVNHDVDLHDELVDDDEIEADTQDEPSHHRPSHQRRPLQRSGDVALMLDALMARLDAASAPKPVTTVVDPPTSAPRRRDGDEEASDVEVVPEEDDAEYHTYVDHHHNNGEEDAINSSVRRQHGGAVTTASADGGGGEAAVTLDDLLESAVRSADDDDDGEEPTRYSSQQRGEPSPVRLSRVVGSDARRAEDLAESDVQEVTAALQRCCDELTLRLEASGPDDGVTSLRIANPRHPASSDRSRVSLAVRELFSMLISRLWFAEDHEVTANTSSDDAASDSEHSASSDELSPVLGPNSKKRRHHHGRSSYRRFWYPAVRSAGSVTPDALLALLRGPWTTAAVKAIGSTPPGVASMAPLPLLRRAASLSDSENTVCATPFDPAVAVSAAQREIEREPYAALQVRVLYRPKRTGFLDSRAISLEPGTVIAGRYRVVDLLGEATFCRAVLCDDLATPLHDESANSIPDEHQRVVLKVINNSKDFFDQSLDEIRNLKLLADAADEMYQSWTDTLDAHRANGNSEEVKDPAVLRAARMVSQYANGTDALHVVRMTEYFYFAEHMCIVCEVLKSNLYDHGKALRRQGQPRYFTLDRVRRIAFQVTTALEFVHSLGLIHNDLKPENILFSSVSRCLVKVIDFGSSCFTTDKLSSYVQSRSYRAPEVFLGAPYDGGIDVWSLGCILVELLTQEVLFHSASIPEMLARIVETCGGVPLALLSRSRHADTLFTRDGVIFAPTADGDDVRHELYGDRNNKPFAVVKSAFDMDATLALRDAELAVSQGRPVVPRSSQCPVNADGSFDAPEAFGQGNNLSAADDEEEDGLYLFLPAHETPPRTAADLGPTWLSLGRAMNDGMQTGDEEVIVSAQLVLDFLADLRASTSPPETLPDVRLERTLAELASFDFADALQSLATLEEHVRREVTATARTAREAVTLDVPSANTSASLASGVVTPIDPSSVIPCDVLCSSGIQSLLLLHFVKLCLLVDPRERPTTDKLAKHPFLMVEVLTQQLDPEH